MKNRTSALAGGCAALLSLGARGFKKRPVVHADKRSCSSEASQAIVHLIGEGLRCLEASVGDCPRARCVPAQGIALVPGFEAGQVGRHNPQCMHCLEHASRGTRRDLAWRSQVEDLSGIEEVVGVEGPFDLFQ